MNRLTIIGNLTNDPEMRATPSGAQVANFTVAVNSRRNGEDTAQFFRVSAWNKLAENCHAYLRKGRKVCVVGPVSATSYQAKDGTTRASLEVMANEVEFLSSRNDAPAEEPAIAPHEPIPVDTPDDLPF